MRQYEILCANDAGRAPRKYPAILHVLMRMNALIEKNEIKIQDKVWTNLVSLYSKDPQRAPTITSFCIGVRSLSLSSLSQRNAVMVQKTSSSCLLVT